MQLRPELRFSGGTPGLKSDAEPAAKSIQTWSLTRTHMTHARTRKRTGEHALTLQREEKTPSSAQVSAPCEGDADETVVQQTSTSRLFTSFHHFLQPLY